MISKMSFGHSRSLAFLRTIGRVYTIRDINYNTGVAKVPQLRGEVVHRKLVRPFRFDSRYETPRFDLSPYLKESGFDSVDDWVDSAEWYRKDGEERRPFFLYRVWRTGGLPRNSRDLNDFKDSGGIVGQQQL